MTYYEAAGSMGGVNKRIKFWNPYPDRRRDRPCEAWQPIPHSRRDQVLNPASLHCYALRDVSSSTTKDEGRIVSLGSPFRGEPLFFARFAATYRATGDRGRSHLTRF